MSQGTGWTGDRAPAQPRLGSAPARRSRPFSSPRCRWGTAFLFVTLDSASLSPSRPLHGLLLPLSLLAPGPSFPTAPGLERPNTRSELRLAASGSGGCMAGMVS